MVLKDRRVEEVVEDGQEQEGDEMGPVVADGVKDVVFIGCSFVSFRHGRREGC